MKDLLTAGMTPNVQYVLNAEDLERVVKGIVSEAISEKETERDERYLTVRDVARMLGVTSSTLWRWEKEHYLVPVRFGKKVRYKESDIRTIAEGGGHE